MENYSLGCADFTSSYRYDRQSMYDLTGNPVSVIV